MASAPSRGSLIRFIFYSVWAVLMTALTYFLGGVSLKVLRRKAGRLGYWVVMTALSAMLLAAGFQGLSLTFFSLVVLIGVFSEFEEMGLSLSVGAFFTLVFNSLLAAGAFAAWAYVNGPQWSKALQTQFEGTLKPMMEMNPQLQLDYQELLMITPSAILCLWICALYLAILLESRLAAAEAQATAVELIEAEAGKVAPAPMKSQLFDLRMPDPVVWIFIASLLGTYGGFGVKWIEVVAMNALNVCLVLFFFQGIGIVAKLYERLRLGLFWQMLGIVVLVYLFPVVSMLGLVDYWFDFRTRMNKRAEQFNREME